MNKKNAWLHFRTGVWVLIFAIIPSAILFAVVAIIQRGAMVEGGLGGIVWMLLLFIAPILIVLYLIISGWAARKGVAQVRG